MKTFRPSLFVALAALLLSAGCNSIDVTSGGISSRVLNGTVAAGMGLPAGSEITVRLFAVSAAPEGPRPANNELVPLLRPTQGGERVLGEQTQKLAAGTADPVPFQIEYTADDATVRHGLNVEARISFGGKLRYRTINAHVVTLASSAFRQEVAVQSVER